MEIHSMNIHKMMHESLRSETLFHCQTYRAPKCMSLLLAKRSTNARNRQFLRKLPVEMFNDWFILLYFKLHKDLKLKWNSLHSNLRVSYRESQAISQNTRSKWYWSIQKIDEWICGIERIKPNNPKRQGGWPKQAWSFHFLPFSRCMKFYNFGKFLLHLKTFLNREMLACIFERILEFIQ